MSDAFNQLTTAQAERLALLAEECGEVVQAVAKILRHGYNSCHPDAGRADDDNRAALVKEVGDVLAAIELLARAKDVEMHHINHRKSDKLNRVGQYLHHAKVKP